MKAASVRQRERRLGKKQTCLHLALKHPASTSLRGKKKRKKNLFKPPSGWDLVMTALENEDMELCRLLTRRFLCYDED